MKEIKAKKPVEIRCNTYELELFLGRAENGAWLKSNTQDVKKLKQGEKTGAIHGLTGQDKVLQVEYGLQQVLRGIPPPKSNEIHVLVVIPKEAGGNEGLESMVSRVSKTIGEKTAQEFKRYAEETREQHCQLVCALKEAKDKCRRLERAVNPPPPSKSDSEMGQERFNLLWKMGCVSSAEEKVGADAFWSVEVQADANNTKTEKELISFITPYFSEALDSHDIVIVNSEHDEWLRQSTCVNINTALKPGGFVTHRGMYHVEREPDNDVSQMDSTFRGGKAVKALYDCLVLFESKISKRLEGTPFGQVMRYLRHLFPNGIGSAVLFNQTTFWLINSLDGVVIRIITAEWVMQGSKALFRDFVMKNLSPWVQRLTASCSALNVEVVEGDSFLGDGAFGRVFKVKRIGGQEGDVLALKIVDENSDDLLFLEVTALMRAQSTGVVIRPVGKVTQISDGPKGAATLLSPVGKPIPYPTTRQEARALFDMLWKLHSAGVVHGDPRMPNVIEKDGQLLWIDVAKWIDFDESEAVVRLQKRDDVKILTQSILHGFLDGPPDLELEALINKYGERPTLTNFDLLANKVSDKLAANYSGH
ncbi:hypothetical protein PsorP6_013517 [Peronosclerospora sorghi]|uniref:Uncharacterized protein n=1 Tax=Peronosclerospora sorghi TaxID=230839 RepID=A0ACC0VHY7_9STRA|nr:hypothetical protein PsorP6_013517 [Peronosclerospora sorghi]